MALVIAGSFGLFACAERASSAPPSSSGPSGPSAVAAARRGGGWGPRGGYGRLYDASTVETMRGQVARVDRVPPMRGMSTGVHVIIRAQDGGTIPVHLGPAWFIDNQDFAVQPGDTLEVTGSRVTFDGAAVLIARTVVNGDDKLVLRDEAGFPMWSASRRWRGP